MITFPVHTIETASDAGKARLEVSQKTYGSIPNLHGVMAASPAMLEAYQALNKIFMTNSLTNVERNIVWMTANYENGCTYCMAAHSLIAKMTGVGEPDLEALRTGAELQDAKLQTLREFTRHVIAERGWVAPKQLEAMEAAGYTGETVLDVILGVGMKTLSNYTNHVANTPLDDGFKDYEWEKRAAA